MTLQTLNLVLVWLGFLTALAMPVRYWIGARRWWRNPLGWVLMSLAAIIILLYAKTVLAVLTGVPLKVTGANVTINGVVVGWIVAADLVIDYIIRKDRRKQQQPTVHTGK